MYLYDTDGSTLITYNDDGGTGLASHIAWTAPASGDYYIRVRQYRGSIYGANTDYDLRVTSAVATDSRCLWPPDRFLTSARRLSTSEKRSSNPSSGTFCRNRARKVFSVSSTVSSGYSACD